MRIGAFYYLWYSGSWLKKTVRYRLGQMPLLGEYQSFNTEIIKEHKRMAEFAGIDFLVCSYSGQNFPLACFSYLPTFCFHYEMSKYKTDDITIVITDEFHKDFEKMKPIFSLDNYLKINGKPVVYFYLSRLVKSGISFICDLRNELYMLGDEMWWSYPTQHAPIFDEIYCYNFYKYSLNGGLGFNQKYVCCYGHDYLDRTHELYDYYASRFKTQMTVIPRYNDRVFRPEADHYVVPDLNGQFFVEGLKCFSKTDTLLITSFNEWYEDTQVEPAHSFSSSTEDLSVITQGWDHSNYGWDCLLALKNAKNDN